LPKTIVGFPHGPGEASAYVIWCGSSSADLHKILVGRAQRDRSIASPDHIHFVPELPKTRSGKIMRRILRKVAAGERGMDSFGDISTLADPTIVQTILDTAPDA
jgi:acetyl-CoA synthetase